MNVIQLNKNSSIPLYRQLINVIKNNIENRILKENDQIPTEIELSEQYQISRITVRKAVSELVEDGYLVKQQGIGTFVAEKKVERDMRIFSGFTEYCKSIGKIPSTRLIGAELREATEREHNLLGLSTKEKIISIRRLQLVDGMPVVIDEDHFPTQYSYLLSEDLTSSLYATLNKNNVYPDQSRQELDICFATKEEAELLEVEKGTALALFRGVVYTHQKEPLHTSHMLVNSNRIKIIV